jgi:2-dehydro-3-deoxyphosphogluconate aldolase/(4S)-4-hydroxy-2-oxoglutarate aldolase
MMPDRTPPACGVTETLHRTRVLAIFRFPGGGDTLSAIRAARAGGIPLCEVTSDTPRALQVISAAAEDGPAGLGTVTTAQQVADCAAAGGSFVVSPAVIGEVVTAALNRGLVPLPGVLTPGDVLTAQRLGAAVLKLFPAGPLGASYLAALRGPFPDTPFVATGGIDDTNAAAFLAAGAAAVAVGSSLAGRRPPAGRDECRQITCRAAALLVTLRPAAAPTVPGQPPARSPEPEPAP